MLHGIGAVMGVTGNRVQGAHVFGYLQEGTMLIPRYWLIMEGELTDSAEYS